MTSSSSHVSFTLSQSTAALSNSKDLEKLDLRNLLDQISSNCSHASRQSANPRRLVIKQPNSPALEVFMNLPIWAASNNNPQKFGQTLGDPALLNTSLSNFTRLQNFADFVIQQEFGQTPDDPASLNTSLSNFTSLKSFINFVTQEAIPVTGQYLGTGSVTQEQEKKISYDQSIMEYADRNGNPIYTYVGLCVNGQRHKHGFEFGRGFFRRVSYRKGTHMWGKEAKIDFSGRIYKGNISNHRVRGQSGIQFDNPVKIVYPNGNVYFGQIKELQPCGFGVLKLSNGATYVGHFLDGQPTDSKSFLQEKTENVSETRFENLKSFYKFANQPVHPMKDTYVGEMKDGTFDGYGIMKYKDEDDNHIYTFHGYYEQGEQKNGFQVFGDGFKFYRQVGYSTTQTKIPLLNGNYTILSDKKGTILGPVKVKYPNGAMYIGYVYPSSLKPHGMGILKHSGNLYKGRFEQGFFRGTVAKTVQSSGLLPGTANTRLEKRGREVVSADLPSSKYPRTSHSQNDSIDLTEEVS